MNSRNACFAITLFLCIAPASFSATAQTSTTQPKAGDAKMEQPMSTTDMTAGEVRKVDKDAKKITIRHGEIKNLEMPGMTMVFQVKDSAFLDKVQTGDKVKFKVEKSGSAIVITDIQVEK